MPATRHRRPSRRSAALVAVAATVVGSAGLAVLTGGAHAADANLVANGDFESGSLSNWSCSPGTATTVTSPVHSGSYALQATPTGADTAQCTQTVTVQPNSSYSLSGWVKGSYVYLGARGTGGNDPSTWTAGTAGWQQLSTSFTTGAGTTSVTLYLHGWYSQPAYYADDITLTGAAGPPSPAPTPTATSPTPTPGPTGAPGGGGAIHVAPYVDMGSWPTPVLSDMAKAGNLRDFTLAFVTSSGCKASWFAAYDPRAAWAKDQIDAVRAAGGEVKVSFGGANGTELAAACSTVDSLFTEYDAVVNAYNLSYVDFDIEGSAVADTASVDRRSQALARLQQAHPGLQVSLTLPVLPEGLTADGLNVVKSAINAGVNLDLVNVMAMDYNRGVDYGDAAVQAAQSTHDQLQNLYPAKSDAQLWAMVGDTPMLGQNDDGHIFNQDAARKLVSFAQQKHLGLLSFWEETRDRNACTGATYKCTNITQSPYEFSNIFAQYTG